MLAGEINNILAALDAAYEAAAFRKYVRGVNALYQFLETRGLYLTAADHLARALLVAQQLSPALLASTLLNSARVAEKRGDYDVAEERLREALKTCVRAPRLLADLYRLLGIVTGNRGSNVEAEDYLKKGLEIARGAGDRGREGALLERLGVVCQRRGELREAERYNLQALDAARGAGRPEVLRAALLNLGVVACQLKDYPRAEGYLREGLELAGRVEDFEKLAGLHHALGMLYRERAEGGGGDEKSLFGEAEKELLVALDHARRIGHYWYQGLVLIELGLVYLPQGRLPEATAAFSEGLSVVRPTGAHDLVALALFGLARAAAARGEGPEARRRGRASLAIYEAIGHGDAAAVRDWLKALEASG